MDDYSCGIAIPNEWGGVLCFLPPKQKEGIEMSGYKQCRSCGEPIESPHACCHFCGWNQSYRPTPKQKEGETMKECKRDKCEAEMSNNRKFCYECGFDQSKDPGEEPFCVIKVTTPEQAAYLRGLVNSGPRCDARAREDNLYSAFPGGKKALLDMGFEADVGVIYNVLTRALKAANIDSRNAPWLKKKYRKTVGCWEITPTLGGIIASGDGRTWNVPASDLRGWLEASEEMDN